MTIEQIQAMWDRWQVAPEWANWWAVDMDGEAYWYKEKPEYHAHEKQWNPDMISPFEGFFGMAAVPVDPESTLEPRPPAAIGVLLGVINRLNRLCDNAHGFYDLTLEKRLYAVDVDDIKAVIAGEQE